MKKNDKPYGGSLKNKVDALFTTSAITPEPTSQQSLSINSITLPDYQPRQYFDPDSLTQLAETIAAHGILEPLLVRKLEERRYELIAGGRRFRAAQILGLGEVPVKILQLTDEEALEFALLENLAREDLNPVEEVEGILQLLETKLKLSREEITSFLYRMRNEAKGMTSRNVSASDQAKVIEKLFIPLGLSWKSFVETRLSLLNLPEEVLETLRQGKLAYTKAKAIAKVKDPKQRQALLEEAITSNLSLSQIKERIKVLQPTPEKSPPRTQLDLTYRRLRSSKLWENPKKWKRAQSLLQKLEALLEEE